MAKETVFEKWKTKLLNNRIIVIIVFSFIIISSVLSLNISFPSFGQHSTFLSDGTNSPYVQYGGLEIVTNGNHIDTNKWCLYKARFANIRFKLYLGNSSDQAYSTVNCQFEENPMYDCRLAVTPITLHAYTSENVYITDETKDVKRVQINYISDLENIPRCRLVFDGIIKNSILQGELKWVRLKREENPNLKFTIRSLIKIAI